MKTTSGGGSLLQTLKNEAKEQADAIIHLEGEVEGLKKSIKFKDRVIEALKSSDEDKMADRSVNKTMERKLDEAEILNLQLVKKMESMKKEFLEKKKQLADSEAKITKLENELANPSTEVSHAKRKMKGTELASLEEENAKLRDEIAELKRQLSSSSVKSSEIEKFEKITAELRSRLYGVKQESDATRRNIKAYESEVSSLRAMLEQSESRNEVLKGHLSEFHARNRQLEQQTPRRETSSSTNHELVQAAVQKERMQNYAQMQSLVAQLKYLRLKVDLESSYRSDLTFMKRFFLLKIDAYQACNRADLALLEEMDIYPDYSRLEREGGPKRTLAGVAWMVVASVRWQKRGVLLKEVGQRREQVRKRVKPRSERAT